MAIVPFAKRYAIAICGAAYAFSFGLAKKRHRQLVHQVAEHFGYRDHPPRTLPQVSIDALTSYATPVVLAEAEPIDGNVTIYELLCLARVVRERNREALLKLGHSTAVRY